MLMQPECWVTLSSLKHDPLEGGPEDSESWKKDDLEARGLTGSSLALFTGSRSDTASGVVTMLGWAPWSCSHTHEDNHSEHTEWPNSTCKEFFLWPEVVPYLE